MTTLIVLGVALIFLFASLYMYTNRWKFDPLGYMFLVIGIVLVLIVCLVPLAHSRDLDGKYAQANPEMHKWVESLRSKKGPCCSDADGVTVADADWESHNGHYRVRIPDTGYIMDDQKQNWVWVDVPDEAVITEPNRLGRTMVWPIKGYLGLTIRCFMPGPAS